MQSFGTKYLVFSRFPDGYPVLDVQRDEAERIIKRFTPGVPLTRDMFVYGRAKTNGRDVGVVLYPLNEVCRRELNTLLRHPYINEARLEDAINDRLPHWINQDRGSTMVFDRSLDRLVTQPDEWLKDPHLTTNSWQAVGSETDPNADLFMPKEATTETDTSPEADEVAATAATSPFTLPTPPPIPLATQPGYSPKLQQASQWVHHGDTPPANPFIWHSKAPPFSVQHAPT